jgi:hypothetical protein
MLPMMSAMFESATGLKLRDLIDGMKTNGSTPNGEADAVIVAEPEVGITVAPPAPAAPEVDRLAAAPAGGAEAAAPAEAPTKE